MFVLRSSVADALPFSAGVTLYVAASDLIPEVNREPGAGHGGAGVFRRGDHAGAEVSVPRMTCRRLSPQVYYAISGLDACVVLGVILSVATHSQPQLYEATVC